MLSAKHDGNRAGSTSPRIISPNGGAVGKVVNSIQGLQQRLNDYPLEEIAAAENKSRTLLRGLLSLQSRVGSLIAIKRAMTVVYEAVEKATSEDINLSTIDTLGKPIHLRDIIQASNLIKFPGLKGTLRQSAERIVPNPPNGDPIIEEANDTPKSIREVIRARSAAESRESNDSPNEPAFVFDAIEIEAAPGVPSADFSWDKDSDPDENNVPDLRHEPEIQTPQVGSGPSKTNHRDVSTTGFLQEKVPEESNTSISRALVPIGGDFDQRLLDDLIKNYGEFFSSSDSPKQVVSEAKTDTTEIGNKASFAEEMAIESAKNNTARTLPLKKEGDIDRELKKIIKDYGQYDIYSRQNRTNLKYAAIGGFLLLVALSSGFYFFSSSKSQEASSAPAAAEPVYAISDENSSGIRDLKRPTRANDGKTPNKSPTLKK
jgi:hypothetical protein